LKYDLAKLHRSVLHINECQLRAVRVGQIETIQQGFGDAANGSSEPIV
jgi:hypothetical protein